MNILGDIFNNIFTPVRNFLVSIINLVIGVLPDSPFNSISFGSLDVYLPYINWVIPVGQIIAVTLAWATAIGVFYVYSTILRWVKSIE